MAMKVWDKFGISGVWIPFQSGPASIAASLGGSNWPKILASTLLGLLISTIGMDPIMGVRRFTFNVIQLYDGFTFIPALIGLLALSEVFIQIEEFDLKIKKDSQVNAKTVWPSIKEYWKLKYTVLRASLIGTIIGIFPGAGATIATFIAYDVEKRVSKQPEDFGKGKPEGVAAAEAANSSSVGGALVPLLTLGIPGSATTAILIGALMIHNLQPGPELFTKNPELIYRLFGSMFIANAIMLLLGLGGSRIWIKVTKVRKEILFPLIFSFALIGSYAVKSSMVDVIICAGFGIVGWILKRYKFPLPPIVLGMILGSMAEVNFRRAVMMAGYTVFFVRPITLTLLIITLLSFSYPYIEAKIAAPKKARNAGVGK